MSNIVNNYSSTIITIFQDIVKNYENAQETIKQIEEELNDINHEIEMSTPKNMYKGYLLYKDIRELRIKRREAKEQVEILKEFYDYIKSNQGQSVKTSIQKIQGNAAKVRKQQESRTYIPRQRNDLTITDETCTAYKPFEEMLADFKQNKAYMSGGKLRK